MSLQFDPTATQADLRVEGDHWLVAFESVQDATRREPDTNWNFQVISKEEVQSAVGDDYATHLDDVISYVEKALRAAGWRAQRRGVSVSPPFLETWDLSSASEHGGRSHWFS
jgi:hypothetical protein